MGEITIRFYEELNDYLPFHKRKRDIAVKIQKRKNIGEIIKSFGVPLEEVDLVLVNSEPVDPAHLVDGGERVSIYPVFESFDIGTISRMPSSPLRKTTFILPTSLKSLADELEKLGHDVAVASSLTDLVQRVELEKRILVTTDRVTDERMPVSRFLYVHAGSIKSQIKYIVDRLHLEKH